MTDIPDSIMETRRKRKNFKVIDTLPDKVYITKDAWEKIWRIQEVVGGYEWYGWTLSENGNPKVITDIFLPFQRASRAHVSVSEEKVVDGYEELKESSPGKSPNGWVHSHGDIGISWSGTDRRNHEVVLTNFVADFTRIPVKKATYTLPTVSRETNMKEVYDTYLVVSEGLSGKDVEVVKNIFESFAYAIVVNDRKDHKQVVITQEKDTDTDLELVESSLPIDMDVYELVVERVRGVPLRRRVLQPQKTRSRGVPYKPETAVIDSSRVSEEIDVQKTFVEVIEKEVVNEISEMERKPPVYLKNVESDVSGIDVKEVLESPKIPVQFVEDLRTFFKNKCFALYSKEGPNPKIVLSDEEGYRNFEIKSENGIDYVAILPGALLVTSNSQSYLLNLGASSDELTSKRLPHIIGMWDFEDYLQGVIEEDEGIYELNFGLIDGKFTKMTDRQIRRKVKQVYNVDDYSLVFFENEDPTQIIRNSFSFNVKERVRIYFDMEARLNLEMGTMECLSGREKIEEPYITISMPPRRFKVYSDGVSFLEGGKEKYIPHLGFTLGRLKNVYSGRSAP